MKINVSELKELLKSKGLSEGLLDNLMGRIKNANSQDKLKSIEIDIKDSEENVKKTKEVLKKAFINKFGSLEKTPQTYLSFLDI